MSASIQVKCSKCCTLLRFSPTGEISTLKCPKCQQQLRIKTPGGNRSAGQATRGPTANPGPTANSGLQSPAVMSAVPSPDLDWDDIAAPAPRGQAPSYQSNASANHGATARRFEHAAGPVAAKRKSTARGVLKPVLIGCGALAGLAVLGITALVVIGLVFGSGPASKSTATLAGYSADAPGRLVEPSSGGPVVGVGIFHRRTNSEFAMATKQVAQPGQAFELETLIQVMKQQGGVVGTTKPVSRAGLEGVRLTLRNPAGLVSLTEIYKLDDQTILMMNYVSGNAKHAVGLGKINLDPAKTNEWDNPDAFFSSLRKG